jgi:hypothetical protein
MSGLNEGKMTLKKKFANYKIKAYTTPSTIYFSLSKKVPYIKDDDHQKQFEDDLRFFFLLKNIIS